MPRVKTIGSLEDAFAQALAAHRTFEDDETLGHVSMGRYNQDLSHMSDLSGTYYWHLNANRNRSLSGPDKDQRSGGGRSLEDIRQREIAEIIAAYSEAKERLASVLLAEADEAAA